MKDKHIRLVIVSGLSLMIILVSLVISEWLRNTSERSVARSSEVKVRILETFRILQNIETSQRGYLLTGEDWYLQPLQQQEQKVTFNVAVLREKMRKNQTQLEYLHEFEQLSQAKLVEMKEIIDLYEAGKRRQALDLVRTDQGELLMNKVEALVNNMIGEEDRILLESQNYNSLINFIFYGLLFLAFSTAAFSLLRLFGRVSPLVESLSSINEQLQQSLDAKEEEIRQRKAIQKINLRLIEDLRSKNEELDHFAYVASHDLKEPLRTVDNFVDLFKEDYEAQLGPEAQQYFKFIKDATTRMRNLIEGLLQYSRLGKSSAFREVAFAEIVAEARDNLQATIMDKDALVMFGQLPKMHCLKLEITQLFQNLMSNALKFIAPETQPVIRIESADLGDQWQFCVKDNGIGISPANQQKIFDMFTRLHGESKYSGQGIGLAFCRRIVELHKGKIWVESEPNKGSAFFFTIKKSLTNEEKIG